MAKIYNNMDSYERGLNLGYRSFDGPIVTFQVTDAEKVVCRFRNDHIHDIMEWLANEHNGHMEFHDADHYYDDSVAAVIDYVKDENKLTAEELESLKHVGGGFEDFKEEVERLLKRDGGTVGKMVESALDQAQFYYNVIDKGENVCNITMYGKDDVLDHNTSKYFDSYSEGLRHILALQGKVYGAVIHDKEMKEVLAKADNEILGKISNPKVKEQILKELTGIVREQKESYPTAHAYLAEQDNNKTASR